MQTVKVVVTGMHCGGCERRVAGALTEVNGVFGVMANHQTGLVAVSYDPEHVAPAAIVERLLETGFRLPDVPVHSGHT